MQHKQRCRIYIILLSLVLLIGFLVPYSRNMVSAGEPKVDVRLHFIDVGQGDCMFIELPDGKTMLIDAGLEKYGNQVVKYIKNLGYKKIDYMIATHADADHIGGLIKVLEKLDVETIYRPFTISTNTTRLNFTDELYTKFEENIDAYATNAEEVYARFLKAVYAEKINGIQSNIKVCTNKEFIGSDDPENPYMFRFFLPFGDTEFSTDRIQKGYTTKYVSESNDTSALILLTLKHTKYLFAGDVTTTQEAELLNKLIMPDKEQLASVTLLKLAHHGSRDSSSEEFLSMVNPSHAVIMASADNQYGLPHNEVINRLDNLGTKIYCTDELGTIIVEEIAGVLYFSNIETKTFFEKFQWLFYLILGLIVLGLILLIYLYPRFKKENNGKNKLKFWEKKSKLNKPSKFTEGPEDENFS